MLTALTVDGWTAPHPRDASRSAQQPPRSSSARDLLDEFSDLAHAAEAAARRMARAA